MKMIYGPGTYTGMINKTSGLASGFGRFIWVPFNIWEGQFYEGKFHGVSRQLHHNELQYDMFVNDQL
jgi:hypothetical protein